MQSELIYHFKPYMIFVLGFCCGHLDHPIKWISVVMLLGASLLIEWWRFKSNSIVHAIIEDTYA